MVKQFQHLLRLVLIVVFLNQQKKKLQIASPLIFTRVNRTGLVIGALTGLLLAELEPRLAKTRRLAFPGATPESRKAGRTGSLAFDVH